MKSNIVSIGREEVFSGIGLLAIRKEHEKAVRTFAVESYLLEEMSEENEIFFEQHCVECVTCAEAVESGRVFLSNIAPLPQRIPWFERAFRIFAAAAWLKPAAAMTVVWLPLLGWQQFRISELSGPHANTVILARGFEKSLEEKIAYPLTTPSATIEFCIPPASAFSFYRVKIVGGQGTGLSQIVPAPAKDSAYRLSVQVSRRALGSGHFAVLVEGLDREDSKNGHKLDETYEFDLK